MNTAKTRSGGHMTDLLFTLALFCVLAASSLLVVLIGSNVYRSTVDNMDQNFNLCTSVSYVSTKIRQHDMAGAVYTGTLDGVDALVLEQRVGETVYQTWIYHHDGALRELFVQADDLAGFSPDSGISIIPVEEFAVDRVRKDMLRLTAKNGNDSLELLVGLRT